MLDYRRTHTCGELNISHVNATVTLSGWVHRRRDHGGLIFIDIRDRYGLTQLVFDPKVSKQSHDAASKLRAEWVISTKGRVVARKEGMKNPKLKTGEIEINVENLTILSESKVPPFSICDEEIETHDELRLKYRYLDIRRGAIASNLAVRHKAMLAARKYFDHHHFLEITTPILGRSTLEGAREYLVPSRLHPGCFYALPQSPQLYKQLLMISGMDRYFQIAPCFRDEDLRSDRQPEFMQIDLEMSFGVKDDILTLLEGLIATIFRECIGLTIKTPFQKILYKDCIEFYGTDKPDLRFDMRLIRIDDIAMESNFDVFKLILEKNGSVKGICIKNGADLSRAEIDRYIEFVKSFGLSGLAWMKCQNAELTTGIAKFFSPDLQNTLISRFDAKDGDLLLFGAEKEPLLNQSLDHLRRRIAKERNLIDENIIHCHWVHEFPLFEWKEEENRIISVTHPFTSPDPRDIHLLDTDPLKVRSLAYDLIINGYEVGGGSQRIFTKEMQEKIYKIMGLTQEEITNMFGFFSEALEYGTPPHLGAAFGLDRLLMILCKTENIRDVIAFPKTQKGTDLMTHSPSSVSSQHLKELSLGLKM